jgi:acyl carrier protein
MIRLGFQALISNSQRPLTLAIYCALGLSVLACALGAKVLFSYFLHGSPMLAGWTSIMAMICFFFGLQMLFLGILGAYIGQMALESKGRPFHLTARTINLDGPNPGEECRASPKPQAFGREADADGPFFGAPAVKICEKNRDTPPGRGKPDFTAENTTPGAGTGDAEMVLRETDAIVAEVMSRVLGMPVSSKDNITIAACGEWDSLKHVELIVTLEERFGISFDAADLAELTSQEIFVRNIKELLRGA